MKKIFVFSIIMSVSVNCFADADLTFLAPNTVTPNACVFDNIGVYSNEFEMVPIWEDAVYKCERGYYLPKLSEVCTTCPENSYCPGGEYLYSETLDVGRTSCPDGLVAPDGMWELAQCGRKFRVGDGVLYLRATHQTTPSLRLDVNGDGVADFFANMTKSDVPINKNSTRRLKYQINGTVYFVYDDTVSVPEKTE